MDLLLIIGLIIVLIPGVYYAYKKSFFVIFSKKYNVFPIQLIFTIPVFSGLSISFSMFIYLLFEIFIPSLIEAAMEQFSSYIILLIPIITDVIIICLFNKYIIGKTNLINLSKGSELYIYSPLQKRLNFGGKQHGTKFSYPIRKKGELLIGIQESELIIDERELKNIDFDYTFNGEIVANKKTLQILNELNITGFETRPIKNITGSINNNYFQLLATHIMPKVCDRTKIVSSRMLTLESKIIVNNEMYYDKNVLTEALDFNQSFETFGREGYAYTPPTKYWIVSKKTRSVLIEKLNQYEFDFIPVHLIDDEK